MLYGSIRQWAGSRPWCDGWSKTAQGITVLLRGTLTIDELFILELSI